MSKWSLPLFLLLFKGPWFESEPLKLEGGCEEENAFADPRAGDGSSIANIFDFLSRFKKPAGNQKIGDKNRRTKEDTPSYMQPR
jgi:hypothetical protein